MQARDAEMRLMKERATKTEGLEDTVRRQEVVIERLEAIINTHIKQKRSAGEGLFQEINSFERRSSRS